MASLAHQLRLRQVPQRHRLLTRLQHRRSQHLQQVPNQPPVRLPLALAPVLQLGLLSSRCQIQPYLQLSLLQTRHRKLCQSRRLSFPRRKHRAFRTASLRPCFRDRRQPPPSLKQQKPTQLRP